MNKTKGQRLEDSLRRTISEFDQNPYSTGEIKVSVHDIIRGTHASVNGNDSGWAASIIKVPIMIATLQEIERGKLGLEDKLEVNHRFTLENHDYVSMLPDGSGIEVFNLLYYMIINSDNEATNILADEIGVETVNQSMWRLGMNNSMLGHLLCPGASRYTSEINPDGSNITSSDDMVTLMRHIYDDSFTRLSPYVRVNTDSVMSFTYPSFLGKGKFAGKNIKAKAGVINDSEAGSDVHEVGIIDDHLIVCVMLNKLKEKSFRKGEVENPYSQSESFNDKSILLSDPLSGDEGKSLSEGQVYGEVMKTIGRYF